jgi:hypothetical protein
MIEVKLIDTQPNEVIDIVNELKRKGYQLGIDFDWEYHKPEYNDWSGDAVYNRYTMFKFYTEELATWFELVYK